MRLDYKQIRCKSGRINKSNCVQNQKNIRKVGPCVCEAIQSSWKIFNRDTNTENNFFFLCRIVAFFCVYYGIENCLFVRREKGNIFKGCV